MEQREQAKESASKFFEAFLNSQREFLQGWMNTQKTMLDNWLQATRKFQEAFADLGSPQEGTTPGKEYLKMYNAWLSTVVNSSKIYTDEISKMQEKWKETLQKEKEEAKAPVGA